MKILAPLNHLEYLQPFIDAGADEFFLGFYEEIDEATFGRFFELNRMSGFRRNSSSFRFSEICDAVRLIKSLGKDAYITFNSSGYTPDALQYMIPYIKGLIEAGCDGFIVSCVEMIDLVRRLGGGIIISGIGCTYNSYTAAFYRDMGAKRVILPRDLTIDEIIHIHNTVPDLELETFIMRNGCILSDGNCLGIHVSRYGGLCKTIRTSRKDFIVSDQKDLAHLTQTQQIYDCSLFRNACGLCAIYGMLQANIAACKVVGRLDKHDQVLRDIALVRDNIEIAKSSDTEQDYLQRMILPENCEEVCRNGYSCYYPEILNKRVR